MSLDDLTGDQTALRRDALEIWRAGVDSVRAERLMARALQRTGERLSICGRDFALDEVDRIAVVGTGKAGAGMATAVEEILGPEIVDRKVTGWVNVPADCVRLLRKIVLHAARPAGVNEPTEEGGAGGRQIPDVVD